MAIEVHRPPQRGAHGGQLQRVWQPRRAAQVPWPGAMDVEYMAAKSPTPGVSLRTLKKWWVIAQNNGVIDPFLIRVMETPGTKTTALHEGGWGSTPSVSRGRGPANFLHVSVGGFGAGRLRAFFSFFWRRLGFAGFGLVAIKLALCSRSPQKATMGGLCQRGGHKSWAFLLVFPSIQSEKDHVDPRVISPCLFIWGCSP